jgi:hypothetical protein
VDEIGERMSGRLRSRTPERREECEHGLRFGEVDAELVAVPGMPAERRTAEPVGLGIEEQQDELESVRQAHVVQIGRRGEGDRGVAGVERAAEATVG